MSILEEASTRAAPSGLLRPQVRGKFLFTGDEKLFVRGVTYGAFRPDSSGREYTDVAKIDSDFAEMAASGINAVRIPHTMPPRSLLDAARRHGLRAMVGLSAEQYLGFLIDRKKTLSEIEMLVRVKVRECAGHPALNPRRERHADQLPALSHGRHKARQGDHTAVHRPRDQFACLR